MSTHAREHQLYSGGRSEPQPISVWSTFIRNKNQWKPLSSEREEQSVRELGFAESVSRGSKIENWSTESRRRDQGRSIGRAPLKSEVRGAFFLTWSPIWVSDRITKQTLGQRQGDRLKSVAAASRVIFSWISKKRLSQHWQTDGGSCSSLDNRQARRSPIWITYWYYTSHFGNGLGLSWKSSKARF